MCLGAGAFTAAELLATEVSVLQTLGFRVGAPSAYTFLLLLNAALRPSRRACALACYLTVSAAGLWEGV